MEGSFLTTQDSELRTQDSGLRTQDSELISQNLIAISNSTFLIPHWAQFRTALKPRINTTFLFAVELISWSEKGMSVRNDDGYKDGTN